MKKFLFALCALALALPVAAADANNIKMVTYFPVPYAAYGDLGVTGTCDVGLMGQCALDAGEGLKVAKASSDSRALNTGSIIVRKGTLGLTPQTSVALGTQLTAGSGTGTGVLEFSHDLAVTSINSSRLAKARAMNEAQMTSLNMYGHAFPTCDADDHEISWKKLTMGKKSGVFLVCGAREKVEIPCDESDKPAVSQICGNCGTQTRTVTCDKTKGAWRTGSWGSCTGQGECSAGATDSKSCGSGYTGQQTRTCSSSCKWGTWNRTKCFLNAGSGGSGNDGSTCIEFPTCGKELSPGVFGPCRCTTQPTTRF